MTKVVNMMVLVLTREVFMLVLVVNKMLIMMVLVIAKEVFKMLLVVNKVVILIVLVVVMAMFLLVLMIFQVTLLFKHWSEFGDVIIEYGTMKSPQCKSWIL